MAASSIQATWVFLGKSFFTPGKAPPEYHSELAYQVLFFGYLTH